MLNNEYNDQLEFCLQTERNFQETIQKELHQVVTWIVLPNSYNNLIVLVSVPTPLKPFNCTGLYLG